MPTTGCYVYGLIRAPEGRELGNIGLEHDGGPGRVYALRVDSIAAVVSAQAARGKVLPLRKNLEPHNRVIREVMRTTTIAPMSFGHIAKSEAELVRTLRRNIDNIRAELDRIDGKVEMGLKVKWDVDNIFEHIVTHDRHLAAFRDQLFADGNVPSHAEKIELGRMFEARLNKEREDQTERLIEAFRACSKEVKVNPAKSEKVLTDLALLVTREQVQAFEERVYEVAETLPAQFLFGFDGPWAPFNFVELDLQMEDA